MKGKSCAEQPQTNLEFFAQRPEFKRLAGCQSLELALQAGIALAQLIVDLLGVLHVALGLFQVLAQALGLLHLALKAAQAMVPRHQLLAQLPVFQQCGRCVCGGGGICGSSVGSATGSKHAKE